jgi:hypothetical protein
MVEKHSMILQGMMIPSSDGLNSLTVHYTTAAAHVIKLCNFSISRFIVCYFHFITKPNTVKPIPLNVSQWVTSLILPNYGVHNICFKAEDCKISHHTEWSEIHIIHSWHSLFAPTHPPKTTGIRKQTKNVILSVGNVHRIQQCMHSLFSSCLMQPGEEVLQ